MPANLCMKGLSLGDILKTGCDGGGQSRHPSDLGQIVVETM